LKENQYIIDYKNGLQMIYIFHAVLQAIFYQDILRRQLLMLSRADAVLIIIEI